MEDLEEEGATVVEIEATVMEIEATVVEIEATVVEIEATALTEEMEAMAVETEAMTTTRKITMLRIMTGSTTKKLSTVKEEVADLEEVVLEAEEEAIEEVMATTIRGKKTEVSKKELLEVEEEAQVKATIDMILTE